ncbi:MAG TPA: outer membrane beta-barrel protein [Chitinophagaceae bacterium]|nr:outer membrane beta-barrel protein [Chitinophagaceae bacterium]
MKKIISIIIALAMTSVLSAQNKKGNWLVGVNIGGGGASFGKSESSNSTNPTIFKSDNSNFNISIGPSVGYYISDNVVLGTYLGVGFSSSKNDNSNTATPATSESKYHSVYVSLYPYGRFYFGSNSKGSPYAEVNAGVSFYPGYKGTYTPSTGSGYEYSYDKYTSWNAGFKIGYEHFINPVIGIQYYIGYNYSYYKYDLFYDYTSATDYTNTNKNTSSNINFGAGLAIHLACDKKKK